MAQVNIRIDDALKEQGEALFRSLGMSLSTAFNVFVSQSVRQGGIPFEITARPKALHGEPYMAELRRRAGDAEAGRNMSVHELIEDDGE
jgi:DNA-damage-inducible protein J